MRSHPIGPPSSTGGCSPAPVGSCLSCAAIGFELAPRCRQRAPLYRAHRGIAQLHFFQRVDDYRGDDQARKPLVVRRDNNPRSVLAGGLLNQLFVAALVIVPVAAFAHIVGGELPVLLRLVETGEKAALLFLLAHVQEELADRGPVARGTLFEGGNI